jgi:hypothetical protein
VMATGERASGEIVPMHVLATFIDLLALAMVGAAVRASAP